VTAVDRPVVLFWDIDGTLLTTARAGILALEAALEEITGRRVALDRLIASGLTEHEVAQAVFEIAEMQWDDALVDRFLRAYERHLPASLPLRRGHVMPGAREVLESLAGRDDVVNLLLTGNTPAGARAKLEHYGLLEFFSDGAFCVGPGPRAEIARRAVELAEDRLGRRLDLDRAFVIGDTPHDVAAGRAIGVRTVALAGDPAAREALAAHEPWALLDRLEPAAFLRLIGLDGRSEG
jgi:phosphoglycolate phosphatase-like HAD superfamily hydrolase